MNVVTPSPIGPQSGLNSTYEMEMDKKYFDLIKSGKKPVEGRKKGGRWGKLVPGDTLVIVNKEDQKDTFIVEVVAVREYYDPTDSVMKFLKTETVDATLPGVKSIEEAAKTYTDLLGGMKEIQTAGMIAIQMKTVNQTQKEVSA